MLTPGPRRIWTSRAWLSSPRAMPTLRTKSGSQEQASAEAVGKQVAGTLSESPAPCPFRTPCGPSVIEMEGMPRRSNWCVAHQPSPVSKSAFSSSAILLTSSWALV